ncbi:MAG TPA: LuxR C-terminal-related transcriptional regulator [Castellaniella sp.]|nr:LuxR C-terminal-related transcriptional regulator [Castellaniella sp.]
MATVTVVEPNTLLRLGILKLLQSLGCALSCSGIDYQQLFSGKAQHTSPDLMLLSVPDAYDRMIELVMAAQQGYAPRRLLLLSDTHYLPYSLLNLPSNLAGYISKYSSQDVLKTSVMLVLAGGKCFPHPDMVHPSGDPQSDDNLPPKRRWYEQHGIPCAGHAAEHQPDNLLHAPESARAGETASVGPSAAQAGAAPPGIRALSSELISHEADLLRLTPRQYEVLVLLARGYPIKKISRELNISVATTKTHTEALYQRLSVNSRNAAVYAAVSRGATLGWHDPHNPRVESSAA